MSALTNFIISSIISLFGTLSPEVPSDNSLSELNINVQPTEFKNCGSTEMESDNGRTFKCFELGLKNQL